MTSSTPVNPGQKTTLTDGEKRLIDSYVELAKVAWQQFNQRRDFEFKVTLTLWSALAAAVAGSLTIDRFPSIFQGQMVLVVVGVVLVLLHGYWCVGLSRAQDNDLGVALFYEAKVHEVCGINFPCDLKAKLAAWRGVPRLLRWAIFVQFSVTCLLAGSLVAVNWQRLSENRPVTRTDLEQHKLELEIKKLQMDATTSGPSKQQP